jgi:hypothetical protein
VATPLGWPRWKKISEGLTELPRLILLLNDRFQSLWVWTARVSAKLDNESPAMPSSGDYTAGFFQENSAPAILGAPGSRYTVIGWKRLTTGAGHVLNVDWVEVRGLTGT